MTWLWSKFHSIHYRLVPTDALVYVYVETAQYAHVFKMIVLSI